MKTPRIIRKLLRFLFDKVGLNTATTEQNFLDSVNRIRRIYSQYSVDDIASSLFALNTWLPNVAGPIRLEFLYSVLESISNNLPRVDRISTYRDFELLVMELINATPNFPHLEDFIPEADWGEMKYALNGTIYRVFYGSNLSHPYDFLSAFEVIHTGFEKEYAELINASPVKDLTFCLQLQDDLIDHIEQKDVEIDSISPGHLEVPPEDFWKNATEYIAKEDYIANSDPVLLERFSCDLATCNDTTRLNYNEFCSRAYDGQNCFYFFVKSGECYFPVMPRRYTSILYDTWGAHARDHFHSILSSDAKYDRVPDLELSVFSKQRLPSGTCFGPVSAVDSDKRPSFVTFATAIHADDRMFLIHLVPLSEVFKNLDDYLSKLLDPLKDVQTLFLTKPQRLMDWFERSIIEFRSPNDHRSLTPIFVVAIPSISTAFVTLSVPEEFPATIVPLDELLGVIDEIHDPRDFAAFFDYTNELRSVTQIGAIHSFLDLFASFRDSHSVLLEGALTPDFVTLAPLWGTSYRFKSLAEFWSTHPNECFIGHPRSWMIAGSSRKTALKSRPYKGYAYFEVVDKCVFFINGPLEHVNLKQLEITDLLMQCIRDAIHLYNRDISRLRYTKRQTKIRIFVAPFSVVTTSDKLSHLNIDLSEGQRWKLKVTQMKPKELAVSIVYNDAPVIAALTDATDRSLQVELLVAILESIEAVWIDDESPVAVSRILTEKSKAVRFRIYHEDKQVSIPEFVPKVLPGVREFKLANKRVAKIAYELKVTTGTFTGDEAREQLNRLRRGLVDLINRRVSEYSFANCVGQLIIAIEAILHSHEMTEIEIRRSLEQEVEYDRKARFAAEKGRFRRDRDTCRYLIEKFVQLTPNGQDDLTDSSLKVLLALVDRLLDIYSASDSLRYDVEMAKLTIDSEYVPRISYPSEFEGKDDTYRSEDARIQLGEIGNLDDVPKLEGDVEEHLEELDSAFRKDFGFGIHNLVNVLQVLSCWASVDNVPANAVYHASASEISKRCKYAIRDFDSSTVGKILTLITLSQDSVVRITGEKSPAEDVPVWEHLKRESRYSVQPLIRLGDEYFWGPYSAHIAGQIWFNSAFVHKLPLPLEAPVTISTLKRSHERATRALEDNIVEIVGRFTPLVRRNLYLYEYDDSIDDIGDCDVLALLEDRGLLLNIESKWIDPPHSIKDSSRVASKIFGDFGIDKSNTKSYLEKVESRHNYLRTHGSDLVRKLNWPVPSTELRVVSLFVTQIKFWWTRFPRIETEISFVDCTMLEGFIRGLIRSK